MTHKEFKRLTLAEDEEYIFLYRKDASVPWEEHTKTFFTITKYRMSISTEVLLLGEYALAVKKKVKVNKQAYFHSLDFFPVNVKNVLYIDGQIIRYWLLKKELELLIKDKFGDIVHKAIIEPSFKGYFYEMIYLDHLSKGAYTAELVDLRRDKLILFTSSFIKL